MTSFGTAVEANEDCDSRSWKSAGLSFAATASPDAYLRQFLRIDIGADLISLLVNRHNVDGISRNAMLFCVSRTLLLNPLDGSIKKYL